MHTEPGHDGCTEGSVRLVNSTIEYEGRVEVCVDGVWGTVCGVDAPDATTLCRVAGYSGGTLYFKILEVIFLIFMLLLYSNKVLYHIKNVWRW